MVYYRYMGRYLNQTEQKSELQQRIAAELKAKAAARSKLEGEPNPYGKKPDGVDDAAFMKGTKTTTSLAGVWLAIFVAVTIAFGYFIYLSVTTD